MHKLRAKAGNGKKGFEDDVSGEGMRIFSKLLRARDDGSVAFQCDEMIREYCTESVMKVPARGAGAGVESPYTKLCKRALHSTFCTLDGKGSGGDKYCPAYVDKRDDDPRERVVNE